MMELVCDTINDFNPYEPGNMPAEANDGKKWYVTCTNCIACVAFLGWGGMYNVMVSFGGVMCRPL